MKYYQLFIDTDNNAETYNSVTDILGLQPKESEKNKTSEDRYSTWMYMVIETETDPYFDFINNFLDILEPKFADLEKRGVTRDKILFGSSMNMTNNVEWNFILKKWQDLDKVEFT